MFYKKITNGFLVNLKIITKAKSNEILEAEKDYLRIKIKAVPEKGKANKELVDFLSNILNITKKQIQIKRGLKSSYKQVLIEISDLTNLLK